MTALDILTLLLVGIAAFFGLMRGFVSETLSLIAWVMAMLAVKLFEPMVAGALTGVIGTSSGAAVLAFALVFGITFIVGRMMAKKLGAATRHSALGSVDRLLGLGFGALKGLFGAVILFSLATLIVDTWEGGDAPRPKWMTQSMTYPLLNASAAALTEVVNARRAHHVAAPDADNTANNEADNAI